MKKLLFFTLLLLIPQLAQADRAFYSAFSLVPGATAQGDIVGATTPFRILQGTADGADNRQTIIAGGGGAAENRGSYILLTGNENANAGAINIYGGNNTTSNVNLLVGNASAKVQFFNASTAVMWDINNSGTITQNATNGGDIIMQKAATTLSVKGGGAAATSGTFTCNGVTAVVVSTTNASTGMSLAFSPNTISGTAGIGAPYVSAISAGTSFSVKCSIVGETSTYNWAMIKVT
jgi:hypothetical protein